jgi:hypothetical protein
VLNIVRRLVEARGVHAASSSKSPAMQKRTEVRAPSEFTTADAYAFTRELEKLHPDNRHVRDKIRQQLQVLRDAGLLIHLGREGVSPAQSHIPALRHHQTQAALIHGASTLRSTATEDGPCWLGWLQLRPESIGFPSPPLDGCPNKSRSLTRIVVRLKRGWTRSRPLARPSRAFAFSQIPFAVSQTAQVPSQRPLCLPVVGQASRLTLTIKLPP